MDEAEKLLSSMELEGPRPMSPKAERAFRILSEKRSSAAPASSSGSSASASATPPNVKPDEKLSPAECAAKRYGVSIEEARELGQAHGF